MKKVTQWMSLMLAGLCTQQCTAADYIFDKVGQHVFISFKASHLGYSYILGHFEDFNGRFTYDAADPGSSTASVTIDVKSLDTDHSERDKHLRGPEYFDVDANPKISFTSTSYAGNKTEGTLTGDLNFCGVDQKVDIAVSKIGEGKDPWGGYRSGFEGSVTLTAADYGLPEWIGDVEVYLVVEGVLVE